MSRDEQQAVLAKIKKLFALAGNNPSEAEAAAAIAKAQGLLANHNLSMAQLDQVSEGSGQQTAETARRTKEKVERSAMFKFQRELWQGLADANFCSYWSTKIFHESGIYSTHYHYLIGREDNVVVVKAMGEYLEQVINRQCPYKVGKEVNLWKTGCVERLVERLREKKQEMLRSEAAAATGADHTSTAVVLSSVYQREIHENYRFQTGNNNWCPCTPCTVVRSAKWAKEREEASKETPVVVETAAEPVRAETEAQKKKREEKEARDRARWNEKWEREYRKEREVRGNEAFQSGREAGEKIGLDGQIKGGK